MIFFHYGTVAEPITEDTTLSNLGSLYITSSVTYDTNTIFKRLSLQLDHLDRQTSGTEEELHPILEEKNILPRFSEERLECDLRVESLKKKWGLNKKAVQSKKELLSFPIEIEEIDAILIEKKHSGYINSGKDGRLWIQSWVEQEGYTFIKSEEKLKLITGEAISQLEKNIQRAKECSTAQEWKEVLDVLNISVSDSFLSDDLFGQWKKEKKEKLTTISRIKKWIVAEEEKKESTDILEGRHIAKLTKENNQEK